LPFALLREPGRSHDPGGTREECSTIRHVAIRVTATESDADPLKFNSKSSPSMVSV